ncbi:Plancitoxin-1 [Trichinella sp. T8]|nr:Plancitoxin-1 [Trichinella sp. T8]
MTLRKNFNVYNMCIFLLWFTFPNHSAATTKCQNLNGNAPAQPRGMTLIAGGGAVNWVANPVDVTQMADHSFGKVLEHVIAENAANKFIAYNNIPPDVPKVNTKSNSKGLLMMNPQPADEASWIVHTVPGFPKALRGYLFPPEEIQKGHLFICLTIKESEIDAIAMTLKIATPLIYHNDIPAEQINSRPNLKKLVSDESRILPPLTVTQEISTAGPGGLKITIYSKGEKSRYEIYRRMLAKKLKTTIKVWTTRDKTLKSDCRIFGRNIRLVTSPIAVNGHANSLENDVSQWLVSDPGNKFCVIDKPYHQKSRRWHCALMQKAFLPVSMKWQRIWKTANKKSLQLLYNAHQMDFCFMVLFSQIFRNNIKMAIVYKAPTRNMGKALIAGVVGWQDTPDITMSPANVVAKPLEHVIAANDANKFIAYNNIPPDIPKVKTKSNSKGVLMMNPQVADEAAWIVHTIPGFPKALRRYVFPPEEIQKGHLFICLTIKESEIDAIAMALRIATPLIYHNDIPDDPARPNLKKLVNGESRLTPPLTVTRQISTADAAGLKVTIYSKSEKSKYGIYRNSAVK